MAKLKVAVAGCGGRGRGHMQVLKQFEDVDLIAVCDPVESARNSARDQAGVQNCYDDLGSMLDTESLDAVFVASPAHLNAQVALPCLERGISTLLEKPPGMSVAETQNLRDVANRTDAKAMVGWDRRFHPMIVEARKQIESRGAVTQLVGEFHKSISHFASSNRFPELVMDNMLFETPIHSVDILRAIADSDVAEVHSIVRRAISSYRDVHGALIYFENGCLVHFIANYTTDKRLERYEIHGHNISAYLEGISQGTICCDGQTHEIEKGNTSSTWEQNRYFINRIKDDQPIDLPAANLDEAVKTMTLVEAIKAGTRD
ncbi:TPA: Gfo/Idh/MocA family oxidoreductase [Candidatus Poribacteria bacterium]|nr:Gfo/Idh/MocA family oxidoreductase [Candidatus Poribacteria bacterium]HIM10280.1 Gfo/Idh/MocA family oxidoreductase [Candidatus Poribacteria bacterium]